MPRKALAIELAVLLVAAAILLALQDLSFTTDDLSRGGKGYVSDEIWYVSSARNILEKVFGAQPRQVQGLGATVVYEGTLNSSFLEGLSRACNVSYRSDYYKISAVYVEASSPTRLECFLDGLRSAVKVNDVVYGWMLPDTQGIDTYMNLEHPPAGKYVLCLEMLLLGDYPTYWRIGPIVAGLATLALTVLAVRELTGNDVVAFAAGALLLSDPIYRLLSSIAFLDIYVALFTSLAFYLVARGRRRAAWAAALAGTAFKFNALFALVPVWAAEVRGRARGSASPLIDAVDETARFILKSVAAFLAIQVAVSIPLIEHFGLASWINQSIVGAISWHTGVKCTNCGESAPWDWFLGARAFTPYIYGNGAVVAAMGFWPFWSLALALTILMLPAYKSSRDLRVSGGFTLGILAGFLILWLAGGRTQYSFYAVQLAPTVYAFLASAAYESFTSPDVFLGSLGAWRRALARAGKAAAEAAYWLLLG